MRNFELEIKKAGVLAQQYLDANPHLSLAQYRIAAVIESFATHFNYVDDFIFARIRDETILGHSLSDELGTTIMLNSILDYSSHDPRTGFTGAHELGHIVLGHTLETFTTTKSISSAEKMNSKYALMFSLEILSFPLMFSKLKSLNSIILDKCPLYHKFH
ncbi:ImmA/IrrE family metallo-endopeptidase [Weissella confusa]|uniref:ImmA/IrrE family metallo-endopeptidase n=1 Tax=Weissella confusa TaxID=1583 RepID=UPI001C6F783F|nr:ImmA/IrrE family metallo-endopeptidase [Weissella confusa]QYU58166.1 ImmA/IrrE family metallo-endopeptidase [Weissella confusa]